MLPPAGDNNSIQSLYEILPLRLWGGRENLIPTLKLRALLEHSTLNKKRRVLIFFKTTFSCHFHLNCSLNLINSYTVTHPGMI